MTRRDAAHKESEIEDSMSPQEGGAVAHSKSAVDGRAMAGLFKRGAGGEATNHSFDEEAFGVAHTYCFSMDSGLGVRTDSEDSEGS